MWNKSDFDIVWKLCFDWYNSQVAVPAQENILARPVINARKSATFKVKDTKLFVPVVSLSTADDNKLWEQLKTGLKITIKWNKYRS